MLRHASKLESNMPSHKPGYPAIPFELSDVKGDLRTLEDYRRRWLLLVFHRHLG